MTTKKETLIVTAIASLVAVSASFISLYIRKRTNLRVSDADFERWEVAYYNDFPTSYCGGLEFTSNGDGTCAVTGAYGNYTDVCIPFTSPHGDDVTGIGPLAFYNRNDMTSITIPSSVTSIAPDAFYGCEKLRTIIMSRNTSIDAQTFDFCPVTNLMFIDEDEDDIIY